MRVRVYKNLRRGDWSILDPKTGLVLEHRLSLVLLAVTFIISERVRLRVVARQRRTVHAYADGALVDEAPRHGGLHLHYNPFSGPSFTCDGQVVTSAERVDFRTNGAFLYA
jgi:hypothetical protein